MTRLPRSVDSIPGLKVTVMGLGLHGGGLASAKFFADRGALVTVTDLRDEKTLAPSLEALEGRHFRSVLGRHETSDFAEADIVIKNPAVRKDSPFLAAAKAIETDISVFLRYSESPLVAVTGSKGKSTTASAIHHGFISSGVRSLLGGNITVSPLGFLDETGPHRPVVLELSSWQLADLRGLGVLKPSVAVITAIMPDHMNYYDSMESYVADKRVIYAEQGPEDSTICDFDSPWGRSFASETKARVLWYSGTAEVERGAWMRRIQNPGGAIAVSSGVARLIPGAAPEEIVPALTILRGPIARKNLLVAGLALQTMGLKARDVAAAMASFPGVEHRLEFFGEKDGVRWYNDSAATIPQAVQAALGSFDEPVVLITGGTDKNIDFSPVVDAYAKAKAIILLAGSGTEKLMPLLAARGLKWHGPFDNLEAAVREASRLAVSGDAILLSPGCASFGMFLHEFDRGRKFKETARKILFE